MSRFLEEEKQRQSALKVHVNLFDDVAKDSGIYKKKPRPFCLPVEHAVQNLVPEIRETAITHFASQQIKWHDGQQGKPSNHLCDSQVCCVNFLFPFGNKPIELADILRRVYPDIQEMLPVENGYFVSFEWIGAKNYLGEKISRNGKRTRGANFTSADAIVAFRRRDGSRHVVLIEWKYTESYSSHSLKYAKSGTDRTEIYRHLFEQEDCPIDKNLLPSFDALFYEPFYQLMRQQFLAHEMEKAQELGADIVSVLHIAPAHNKDFRKVTAPELHHLGTSATGVWQRLVQHSGRFHSIETETLFGGINEVDLPGIKSWRDYIYTRYAWVCTE